MSRSVAETRFNTRERWRILWVDHGLPYFGWFFLSFSQSSLPLSSQQANVHANAKNSNDGGEQVLGACQRLRVICAFAKVGATVEFAKNILETEPAIVIFTNFASVAKAVHEQLAASGWNGELYTGETPQKKRQGMVDNFQVSWLRLILCENFSFFARLSNQLFCLYRFLMLGRSIASLCLYIWSRWCWTDSHRCVHNHPSGSTLDAWGHTTSGR